MRRIIRLGYNYNSELCGILDTYLKNVVLVGNIILCFFLHVTLNPIVHRENEEELTTHSSTRII